MRSPLWRLLPVIFIGLFIATAPAGAANAWKTFPTRIFVSEKFPALHGALHSRSRVCLARRRLLVYRPRPGADTVVGRGWSRRSGTWRVPLGKKLEEGHYYVIAPARADPRSRVRCPAARSKSIPVE
ncbi:MAG TPA: hypothetical protein VH299_11900 [Solirubrobacterales bacterium]|jgi:hypothetical protein|nr:hypothetical protein [Solirubrobacterales bacterium]